MHSGVSPAAAAVTTGRLNTPVLSNEFGKAKSRIEGTFGSAGTVAGTFKPRRFKVNKAGHLMAIGVVKATLTRASGTQLGTDKVRVRIPVATMNDTPLNGRVAAAVAACPILHLVLGPLNLNLLGLKVHLNKVILNIKAIPGPGNLLGNLLCAVAGLLDGTGNLPEISQILNSIVAILKL